MVEIESPKGGSKKSSANIFKIIFWLLIIILFLLCFAGIALIAQEQIKTQQALQKLESALIKNSADIDVMMAQSEESSHRYQELTREFVSESKERLGELKSVKDVALKLQKNIDLLSKELEEAQEKLAQIKQETEKTSPASEPNFETVGVVLE